VKVMLERHNECAQPCSAGAELCKNNFKWHNFMPLFTIFYILYLAFTFSIFFSIYSLDSSFKPLNELWTLDKCIALSYQRPPFQLQTHSKIFVGIDSNANVWKYPPWSITLLLLLKSLPINSLKKLAIEYLQQFSS
jgi:hypothetical protein